MAYKIKKKDREMWFVRIEQEKKMPPVYVWTAYEKYGTVYDTLKDARRAAEVVPGAEIVKAGEEE